MVICTYFHLLSQIPHLKTQCILSGAWCLNSLFLAIHTQNLFALLTWNVKYAICITNTFNISDLIGFTKRWGIGDCRVVNCLMDVIATVCLIWGNMPHFTMFLLVMISCNDKLCNQLTAERFTMPWPWLSYHHKRQYHPQLKYKV